MIAVHITHEAVEKIGGIGAVIAGLMTTDAYDEAVSRTILLGPLLMTDRPASRRLGDGGKIIYSSLDGIQPDEYREKFSPIEKTYDVGIIYGTRPVSDPCTGKSVDTEVLLVDVFHSNRDRLNLFKAELYKKFAVPSHEFEDVWEYEQYIRLAEPGFEALKAIHCGDNGEQVVYLAHEYMGMPTALKAMLSGAPNTQTVFYAHEVASVRPIVEKHGGHDTMFYNVLERAAGDGMTLEQVFPSVFSNYKHGLVKAARHCDSVFAVGDYIVDELKFLDKHFKNTEIDLVYNGIPAFELTLEEKKQSRARMQQYAENLFGIKPTWTFAHVARPVLSKGIWRDLGVLHHLEPMLAERGETAVYFMLGTLGGQRRSKDVKQMERVYGWPVTHEMDYPDLCGGEEVVGEMFDAFNRDHEAVRVVFVNQWDWNRKRCGMRMPEDMAFADIRQGTDVEFGLSVYEPFGISQFEPLSFGALCVVSNVCGCTGFARHAAGDGKRDKNIIEANYLHVPEGETLESLMEMGIAIRDGVENDENPQIAAKIIERLPRDDNQMQQMITSGHELAQEMSWECVVNEYFLPGLARMSQD